MLAVVPIIITAGSAVLPTILAALAGAAAILLRPRELATAIARRPWASAAIVIALAASLVGLWQLPGVMSPRRVAKAAEPIDWAAVAREIIARERAGVAAPPATTQAADAVVEGRNFSRSSHDGGPSPLGLKPLWTYAPADTMFLATPAVHGERVYVAGCVADLGAYTGLLACLDAATGRPLWEVTEVDGEPLRAFFSSPAVTADGTCVVIGEGFHTDRNCALRCFDAATGKQRWAAPTTEHVESSPAVAGDLAVVGVGAIEDAAGRPTGNAGHAMAVRITDGRVLWRHDVIDAESSPAVATDGTIFLGSGRNGNALVAIAPDGSRPAWRTDVGMKVTAAVTIAGDLVIAGAGNGDFAHSGDRPAGAVIAFDRVSGQLRWRNDLADDVLGPIAFGGGLLVAPVRTGEVVAIEAADGAVRWRQDIGRGSPALAGVALGDHYVYALAADATLAVLERDSGRVIERHAMNDPARPGVGLSSAAPQVAGGHVFVATETGGVRCLTGSGGTR